MFRIMRRERLPEGERLDLERVLRQDLLYMSALADLRQCVHFTAHSLDRRIHTLLNSVPRRPTSTRPAGHDSTSPG